MCTQISRVPGEGRRSACEARRCGRPARLLADKSLIAFRHDLEIGLEGALKYDLVVALLVPLGAE